MKTQLHTSHDSGFVPRRLAWANRQSWVAALCAAVGFGCASPQPQRVNAPESKRLDELSQEVKGIDERLQKIETLLADILEEEREPDPAEVYAVPIEGDPYSGAEHAKVTLVEAFEFACPYCAQSWATIQQLLADYAGDIKVVYKYYVVHQEAVAAGLAACAAHQQGKFTPMTELIWEKAFAEGDLGVPKLETLAEEASLNLETYRKDLESDTCISWLRRNYGELEGLGVNGTPAFYVNGRYLSGAQPIENFKKLIDEELAKANTSGIPAESYYQKAVLEAGKAKL